MDRMEQLGRIAEGLKANDFEKTAAGEMPMGGPPMDPAAMGGAPMVDPAMMPPVDPATGMPMDPAAMGMDPAAMGAPMPEAPGIEAERGMKEVAMRAMDLTDGVVSTVLGNTGLSPAEKVDASAAALQTSGALQGVPPEEIAALAQQEPPVM